MTLQQVRIASLSALVAMSGCTDIGISKKFEAAPGNGIADLASASGIFELNPPVLQSEVKRVVFFVDMSFSMLANHCEGDTNNPLEPLVPSPGVAPIAATSPASACRQADLATGRDPDGMRFDLTARWVQDLQSEPKNRFMVIPFTGGSIEGNQQYTWLDGQQAIAAIDGLRARQTTDRAVFTQPGRRPAWMGTSIPVPRLKSLTEAVEKEFISLKSSGELSQTTFDIVYISDGVRSPTYSHYQTALNMVRLTDPTRSCNPACARDPSQCSPVGFNDANRCRVARDEMQTLWGDAKLNEISQITRHWRMLAGLPLAIGDGRLRLHLLQLKPASIPVADRTVASNALMAVQNAIPDARLTGITTGSPPYPLQQSTALFDRYQLRHLYVVNPNVRPDAKGSLAIDTDGDGLFDVDEVRIGSDPLQARSRGSRVCIDSLWSQAAFRDRCERSAAQLQCDSRFDGDGDGLNECEERILGTNPRVVDSDRDGIPDGLEMVFGFNPLEADDQLDTDGDGLVNLSSFAKGLGPDLSTKSVPPDRQTNLERTFLGWRNNAQGEARATYRIQLVSFPFVSIPAPASPNPTSYYFPEAKVEQAIPEDLDMVSSVLRPKSNRLLIIMAASTASQPDRIIWSARKVEVGAADRSQPVLLDLSSLKVVSRYDR